MSSNNGHRQQLLYRQEIPCDLIHVKFKIEELESGGKNNIFFSFSMLAPRENQPVAYVDNCKSSMAI